MAGCLVVLLVWKGLKSIFAGCLHGLGGSGFGVKSVFAGCLHGLATFWIGFSMLFCGFLGWFGVWSGELFLLGVSWFWLVWHLVWEYLFGLLCFSSVVLIYIYTQLDKKMIEKASRPRADMATVRYDVKSFLATPLP